MVKLRSVNTAYDELMENSPDCGVTKRFLRTIFESEKVPIIKNGKRMLVDMDVLNTYLENLAGKKGGSDYYDKKK